MIIGLMKQKLIKINKIFFFLLIFLSLTSCENEKPNILWITVEDISPDLGCYGDENANTPVLDKLASEGFMYTNAFANAPVCAPARSAIITGMYPSSIGSLHMRSYAQSISESGELPEEFLFFPEIFRNNGYYCTNNEKEDYNLNIKRKIWDDSSLKAHWRNRKNKNNPFFSVFNLKMTHESCINDKEKHERLTETLPLELRINKDKINIPTYFPDNQIIRTLMARHYDNISQMDIRVGEILNDLKEDGLDKNTIIFFYSDHGTGIPRHKRWLFDSGVKVPLIVYLPKKYRNFYNVKPGTSIDRLVSFVDLAPTVLNISNLDIPQNMQGKPFLGDDIENENKYVFISRGRMDERYDMQRGVRTKEFKYIRYYEPTKPYYQYMNTPEKGEIMKEIRKAHKNGTLPQLGELLMTKSKPYESLYNIIDDPIETKDLANNPFYRNTLDKLRLEHEKFMKDIFDIGLIPEPILRSWEEKYDDDIYSIVRNHDIFYEDLQIMSSSKDQRVLISGLDHQSEAVRFWAAQSLGNIKEKLSKNLLNKILFKINDENLNVSISISRILIRQNLNDEIIFKKLKMGLIDNNEWTRLQSALVIDEFKIATKKLENYIEKSKANDKNKYVVRVVNRSLNKLNNTNFIVK
jgi:arylsulfatase A-like enzyme